MRVVIAPDKFAGTLTAPQAADAIGTGWRRRAPLDDVVAAPMSDGGPGFVDVLHSAVGGDLAATNVTGPLGEQVPATLLLHDGTAYVESAHACGLQLVAPKSTDVESASTVGVGELVAAALEWRARRIVVGLGGSATNDAGAGLLAALGAEADADLRAGPRGFTDVTVVDLRPVRQLLAGVDLVLATDVDNALLGMFGATKVYGPQKGLTDERIQAVDAALERFVVAALGSGLAQRKVADSPGAGAAGGLGFALLAVGGRRGSGIELVAEAVGLRQRVRAADLVVTGEGSFDFSSRAGKVVHGVAALALSALRPCIVLAGQVLIGSREMRAIGIESAYSMVDLVGSAAAFDDPEESLAALAARAARTWSY